MDKFTGTRPLSSALGIDSASLQAWLAARLPGFEGTLTVEQ